jgi:hypothetical protein
MTKELMSTLEDLKKVTESMKPNAKNAALHWIDAVEAGNMYTPEELKGSRMLAVGNPTKLVFPGFRAGTAVEDSARYLRVNGLTPSDALFADAILKFRLVVKA